MFKASDVKELRDRTGAGMLDCKKALEATEGNMDKAIDWLREKGISKAAKKEGRIAAEGLCQIEKIEKKDNEVFGSYKHMGGRIGALVVLSDTTEDVAKDVAMHVAAMNPTAVTRSEVPQDIVEHESHVIKEQVMQEGKPADIAEKMVTGRLNKFYKEVCLEEQPFIKENSVTVGNYVKENGGSIVSISRFEVGEGIEKKEENFAEEVQKQING